jgi:hypothetical protein
MDTPVGLALAKPAGVNQLSPAEAKIRLFRSLFHGREDVHPRRFESR